MSDHLIAEANRHAKALSKMSLPTTQPTQRDIQWYIEECIDLRKQLDRECASKREHLRIACNQINELKVQVGVYESENAALKTALDAQADYQRELRADRDRLDWLLTHEGGSWLYWACEMGQWTPEVGASRAAIDAAMREGKV